MTGFQILDVGCGNTPHGKVNIDIHKKKGVPNFLLADAQYLPFKDRSFNTVFSAHMLEHCVHPSKVLSEFQRVAKQKIVVKVPNVSVWDIGAGHMYSWSKNSFHRLLEQHFTKFTVNIGIRHIPPKPTRKKNLFMARILVDLLRHARTLVMLTLGFSNELVCIAHVEQKVKKCSGKKEQNIIQQTTIK